MRGNGIRTGREGNVATTLARWAAAGRVIAPGGRRPNNVLVIAEPGSHLCRDLARGACASGLLVVAH